MLLDSSSGKLNQGSQSHVRRNSCSRLMHSVSQLRRRSSTAHVPVCGAPCQRKGWGGRKVYRQSCLFWNVSDRLLLQVRLRPGGAAAPSLRSPGDHPDQCRRVSVQVRQLWWDCLCPALPHRKPHVVLREMRSSSDSLLKVKPFSVWITC